MNKGINLGSGKQWRHEGWISLDEIEGNYLDSNSILPAEDNSVENIYSCHFFEHIDDAVALNLFTESYRVLKPNGIMRIAVPDTEKIINKLLTNDYDWFVKIFGTGRPEWDKYKIEKNIVNSCLHILANYDYNGPLGFFRGPPAIDKELVLSQARSLSIGDFYEWVISYIPNGDTIKTQHINWWTYDKFHNMVHKAGFEKTYSSTYMGSKSKEMLFNGKFDNEKPNRRPYSVYFEAIK